MGRPAGGAARRRRSGAGLVRRRGAVAGGWVLAGLSGPALDPWVTAHLDELSDLGRRGVAALAGDRLVHTDVRADNLLVRPDGDVVVVDWPWASRGAAFVDVLALLLNARLSGADVPADALLDAARRPVPDGLPRLRAFQAAQGAVALAWVRERW